MIRVNEADRLYPLFPEHPDKCSKRIALPDLNIVGRVSQLSETVVREPHGGPVEEELLFVKSEVGEKPVILHVPDFPSLCDGRMMFEELMREYNDCLFYHSSLFFILSSRCRDIRQR
jgi:hypothetical protein